MTFLSCLMPKLLLMYTKNKTKKLNFFPKNDARNLKNLIKIREHNKVLKNTISREKEYIEKKNSKKNLIYNL